MKRYYLIPLYSRVDAGNHASQGNTCISSLFGLNIIYVVLKAKYSRRHIVAFADSLTISNLAIQHRFCRGAGGMDYGRYDCQPSYQVIMLFTILHASIRPIIYMHDLAGTNRFGTVSRNFF